MVANPHDNDGSDGSGYQSPSTWTQTTRLVHGLQNYIIATLNHDLPDSRRTRSLLGTIDSIEPGRGDSTRWCVTTEDALRPSRMQYAQINELPHDAVRQKFYVGAAELVSPVTQIDADWVPMYEQIHTDLKFDGEKGLYYNGFGGLHVHFAFQGAKIDLRTAQNVMALYGLYEREIGMWLHVRRRDLKHPIQESPFCHSIRNGMEKLPGMRYTPQDFTDRIYATKSPYELRVEVSTGHRGEYSDSNDYWVRYAKRALHKTVAVHISPYRDNKPLTIEFRQHEATDDPVDIRWWVEFCARLMRLASSHTQMGINIQDDESSSDILVNRSLVENVTKTSILDLLHFPQEGKDHFQRRKMEMNHDAGNAQWALEDKLIQARIDKIRNGRENKRGMDEDIIHEKWYHDEAKALLDTYGIDLREVQNQEVTSDMDYYTSHVDGGWAAR